MQRIPDIPTVIRSPGQMRRNQAYYPPRVPGPLRKVHIVQMLQPVFTSV